VVSRYLLSLRPSSKTKCSIVFLGYLKVFNPRI